MRPEKKNQPMAPPHVVPVADYLVFINDAQRAAVHARNVKTVYDLFSAWCLPGAFLTNAPKLGELHLPSAAVVGANTARSATLGTRATSMHPLLLLAAVGHLSRRAFNVHAAAAAAAAASPATAASAKAPYTWTVVPGPPDSSANAARFYALVTFSNGIRGLVCADAARPRFELAACVGCGSLDDPEGFEGLAHLAEHMTLACDPLGLQTFVEEERQGDTNAFTGERTTTFYTGFDTTKRVARSSSASRAESAVSDATKADVAEASRRFAEIFARALSSSEGLAAPASVVRNEVGRINKEMEDILRRPSRGLVEIGSYKARSSPASAWSRLGRGDETTLKVRSDEEVRRVSDALTELRRQRYRPDGITFAAIAPLPLEEAVTRVADAFVRVPTLERAPPVRARAVVAPTPFADLDADASVRRPVALLRPGRRATLSLAWDVAFDDPLLEARRKPLDLIGHVLTAPHGASLASLLRARGLVPLAVELEPAIDAKTVARADGWALWQVDITLATGAEGRWREAAALTASAIERLAEKGVPEHVGREVQTTADLAWRFSSRPPTALELAADLQLETAPDLSVVGARSFVGDAAALSATANAVATQLAARTPMVTVWSGDLEPLGLAQGGAELRLPPPLGNAVELRTLRAAPRPADANQPASESVPSAAEQWARLYTSSVRPSELLPPPPNVWIPSDMSRTVAQPMPRVGYRVTSPLIGSGSLGYGGSSSGIGTLQLPGCVDRRTLAAITGSKAALEAAMCQTKANGYAFKRPLAVAALQIDSPIPAAASVRQAARGELWRLTLLQALSEYTAPAALAGLKFDISFNAQGVRLLTSGYAQRLPKFMALILRRTLRHLPPPAASAELAAARRRALLAVENDRAAPPGREDELRRAGPEQLQQETTRLFRSMSGARLLLAGSLSAEAADALNAVVLRELEPLLTRAATAPERAPRRLVVERSSAPIDDDVAARVDAALKPSGEAEQLDAWAALLYKPRFATNYAANACLDPALARALDQCGGL